MGNVTVAVMPETRELVKQIAAVTKEKKYAIYDRAIREYAQKIKLGIAPGA